MNSTQCFDCLFLSFSFFFSSLLLHEPRVLPAAFAFYKFLTFPGFCFWVLCGTMKEKQVPGDFFMGKCLVFCAAEFDGLLQDIQEEDYILAADGGLVHVQALGLTPNGILGDFDSLGYVPQDSTVFPVEKDDTDAMLAVRKGLELGYREFVLYGSLDGPRLDHTVANFQTLQFLADHDAAGYLVGKDYIVTVVKNAKLSFSAAAAGIVSVFCMGSDANGVTLTGLQYPLENGRLTAGFPLGVSNHFIGEPAEISVRDGSLLVLFDRSNGLPGREDPV